MPSSEEGGVLSSSWVLMLVGQSNWRTNPVGWMACVWVYLPVSFVKNRRLFSRNSLSVL